MSLASYSPLDCIYYPRVRTTRFTPLQPQKRLLILIPSKWSLKRPLNPFGAPKPLPILNPSNFVPENGFPVVKGLTPLEAQNPFLYTQQS